MRIRDLDIGVEQITQWTVDHEFHLPAEGNKAPAFLPRPRPLDTILRRPSLDERLPDLLQPVELDPGLLDPAVLTQTRKELAHHFENLSAPGGGGADRVFTAAAGMLNADNGLDTEVRAALAVLLRG